MERNIQNKLLKYRAWIKPLLSPGGMNTSLIAIRTLDQPVTVKTEPSKKALGVKTEYKYELIEMDGFTLEE